jgi:hypothetical protein
MENITDTQEPKKETSNKSEGINPLAMFFVVFAIVAFIWAWVQGLVGSGPKIYKGKLTTKYNVDAKTFAKWMKLLYFASDEVKFKEYTDKKKISQYEANKIIKFFGERTKDTPVMTKGKIVKLHGGCYKTLKNSVSKFAHEIGITMEIYEALDAFPPKLTKKILEHYV